MKKLFLIFCSFLFSLSYSQTNYVFNVELSDRGLAPTFTSNNGVLTYAGTNILEGIFFTNYTITNFYQTYPSSRVSKSLNVFTFETTSEALMNDIVNQFPEKYSNIENLTGRTIELLDCPDYHPNDYGILSPVPNLGGQLDLSSFDYINAPKAWSYFLDGSCNNIYNIGNVPIGISDGYVVTTDADFSGKTTHLETSYFTGTALTGDAGHGTGVAAIAAAQGNNAHGMTGVCPDCSIINVSYRRPGSGFTANLNFNGLLVAAQAGAKVINMSWRYVWIGNPDLNISFPSEQAILDELHDMGIVLVAAAGNSSTFPYPNNQYYGFPASYNHVISVTGVHHKYALYEVHGVDTTEPSNSPFYNVPMSYFVRDMISPRVAPNYNGTGLIVPNLFDPTKVLTTNDRVDICAPGSKSPLYSLFLQGQINPLGGATSSAAPYVSGTAALMVSLNTCLYPDEVEDIIQLTAGNLESVQGNEPFLGLIGAGKMETGDSVEFVHEAMEANGNAVIDGHDFWRFNFDLQRINNKLTISNQIFRDGNTSNFVAKNEIDVMSTSDFRPNLDGFVDLKINSLTEPCLALQKVSSNEVKEVPNKNPIVVPRKISLFPNPNKGSFTIQMDKEQKEISVSVFDVFGKLIYSTTANGSSFDLNIPDLPSGLYLVKLNSNDFNETLKFIKQ